MRYFARNGDEITMEQWISLHRDFDYKVVRQEDVGSYFVSTVWLGLDHNWNPEGPPLFFETMVFPADDGESVLALEFDMDCYGSEAAAVAGHEAMVTLVRATMQDVETAVAQAAEDDARETR